MKGLSKNLILIGMPGCGKSTMGEIIAQKLGAKFIDVDEYIESSLGKSINDIFKQGEDAFREIEKRAVCKLSKANNCVISTGGGVIKNYSNIEALKTNGIIVFIDRPIEKIEKDVTISDRPLLKDGTERLYKLFHERYHLYKKYCDFHIINDGEMEQVIDKIIGVI